MNRTVLVAAIAFACGALSVRAMQAAGSNDIARYGESGLPKNCRAIVQSNVEAYRRKTYTADEVIASLERNCGAHGHAWGE